jgi:hypothetical protein
MTDLPLRRVVRVVRGERQRCTFQLECGHLFSLNGVDGKVQAAYASHWRCNACAAAERAASRNTRIALRERRCAHCGKPDVRPTYAPPPPACFHCRARPYLELAVEEDA